MLLENFLSVTSKGWSMSAMLQLFALAVTAAFSISVPGLTPTLLPSFRSASSPKTAKSQPLKPRWVISLRVGRLLVEVVSAW